VNSLLNSVFRDLKGENIVKRHHKVAMEFLESRVLKFPEILGVVILGRITRGYSDKLSDIDIIVFRDKFSDLKRLLEAKLIFNEEERLKICSDKWV